MQPQEIVSGADVVPPETGGGDGVRPRAERRDLARRAQRDDVGRWLGVDPAVLAGAPEPLVDAAAARMRREGAQSAETGRLEAELLAHLDARLLELGESGGVVTRPAAASGQAGRHRTLAWDLVVLAIAGINTLIQPLLVVRGASGADVAQVAALGFDAVAVAMVICHAWLASRFGTAPAGDTAGAADARERTERWDRFWAMQVEDADSASGTFLTAGREQPHLTATSLPLRDHVAYTAAPPLPLRRSGGEERHAQTG